jgi:hypothetical protein
MLSNCKGPGNEQRTDAARLAGAERLIWGLAAGGRWERVPDPVLWQDGDDLERRLNAAGFCRLGSFGVEHSRLTLDLYEHRERDEFLATVWLADRALDVRLDGLPALLEFLRMLFPLVRDNQELEAAEEANAETVRELRRQWQRRGRGAAGRAGREG